MRDYDNMPTLRWDDENAAQKVAAQILRQEPLILQMVRAFDATFDGVDLGCELDDESGILFNCAGADTLRRLASENKLPELNVVADACEESSSLVDVDAANQRLIVHD